MRHRPQCACRHATFAERIEEQTAADRAVIEGKMGRTLSEHERARIGVSQLRTFMEEVLKRLYRKELPEIIGKMDQRIKDAVRPLRIFLAAHL